MDFASNTRNTRRLGVAGLATLFALLSGCFSEPVEAESSATGGSCDPGAFSCECFEGTCEPGLRCTTSNLCITENCTPGTAICECDPQGRCGPGFQCTGNVCLPQGGTTVTPTSSDSSTDTSTTDTSTTMPTDTMPTDTMPSTTSVDTTTTTDPDTTDATESATTDEPLSCVEAAEGGTAEQVCEDCFLCTNANECSAAFDDCEDIDGCLVAAQCLQQCAVSGVCLSDCCAGENGTFQSAALGMHSCREATCSQGACRSFAAIPGFCGA